MNNFDNSETDFYTIDDVDGYCHQTRALVGTTFDTGITDQELDQYITLAQVEKILDDFCDYHEENGLPIICQETHNNICEAILTRINNVGLAKLAADDSLQVAFDEEINDFVFWAT